jgi:predicted metallopeptidase
MKTIDFHQLQSTNYVTIFVENDFGHNFLFIAKFIDKVLVESTVKIVDAYLPKFQRLSKDEQMKLIVFATKELQKHKP